MLTLARTRGSFERRASRGWGYAALWLITVALGLLAIPLVVNLVFDAVPDSAWAELQAGDPHVGDLWSIQNVLFVAAAILTLDWLVRANPG
jgi:hypothetical protein